MSKKATRAPTELQRVAIEERPSLRAGIPFRFAGQMEDEEGNPVSEWVDIELQLPPLNLDSMQLLEAPLKKIKEVQMSQALVTMATAIQHALRRNYTGVPLWLIRQSLDVGNMEEISLALMDLNGLHRREVVAKKAREARVAELAETSQQTGTGSTQP